MSIREKLYSRSRGVRTRTIPSASPEIADPAHSSHTHVIRRCSKNGGTEPNFFLQAGQPATIRPLPSCATESGSSTKWLGVQIYFRAERGEQHGLCVALSRGSILSVDAPPGSTRTYCLTHRAQSTVLRGRPDGLTSLLRYGKAMSHGRTHTKLRRVVCARALPTTNPLTWKS
jgi:hypothetical protein